MVRPSPRRSKSILEDLPFCFARTTLVFRRFSDHSLRAIGVASQAPGLASVLHAADELGDCSVSRLVEMTHLPNGTLTGLLDALEHDGHVRRISNPEDGRSWLIQLTKNGHQLCKKLRGRHVSVMRALGTALSGEEQVLFKQLLDKLTSVMRTDVGEGEEGTDRARATGRILTKPKRPRARATGSGATQNKKL